MILVKDLLSVAYDAASLATVDPGAPSLTESAEDGELLDRIESTASRFGMATLVQTIPAERRGDLSDALGRAANAADYMDGSGWESVIPWTIDLFPSNVRELTAED